MMSAVYSDRLKDKFNRWCIEHRMGATHVARACKRKVSLATWNNLRTDGYVSRNTIEVFLETFPEESAEEWLSLFDEEQKTAAA